MDANNLVELLVGQAASQPDFEVFVYLRDGEEAAERMTFAELDTRARAIAAALQASTQPGDRVMLLYLPGTEFICGYFGCLYAGRIAVPLPPPRPSRLQQTLEKLLAIAASAEPTAVLTSRMLADKATESFAALPALAPLKWIASEEVDLVGAGDWQRPTVHRDDIAFLQYTSGSTALPKGVMLTHGNLLANTDYFAHGCVQAPGSSLLNWLPPFHDLGLIYGLLTPIRLGITGYIMPNASFVQQPSRWVRAISRYRITHTMGPNFAYDLVTQSVTDQQLAELDLSHWQQALNGAEPVRMETMRAFGERFAPAGFRNSVFNPCWGLAEASCVVTGAHFGHPAGDRPEPLGLWVDARALETNRVQLLEAGTAGALWLAASGQAIDDTELAIVDPSSRLRCPAEHIGEIWVRNAAVGQGYWQNPEQSEETFGGVLADDGEARRWMRTGDLGFLHQGQLVITGRLKDVIIIRGRNHYPQDIEWSADHAHPLIRPAGAAAFAIEAAGEELLCLVLEADRRFKAETHGDEVLGAVRQAIAENHELKLAGIAIVRQGTLPKTTSGKIQRRATRDAFIHGELDERLRWVGPLLASHIEVLLNKVAADEPAPVGETALPATNTDIEGQVLTWLRQRIAQITGLDLAQILPERGFAQWGLDSQDAVMLSGEISRHFRLGNLPTTLLFDYATPAQVARFVAERLSAPAGPVEMSAAAPAQRAEIAIVGLAGRFPGAADVDALWRQLLAGGQSIGPLPAARRALIEGFIPEREGFDIEAGWLDGIEQFDAAFFHISPREAESMDPRQRLLLASVWHALEAARIPREELAGSRTGVFIGLSGQEYGQWALLDGEAAQLTTGGANSIAANRISYYLDLHGPSVAVDSACSSSLLALHLACQSLQAGECDTAIVGTANLILDTRLSSALRRAGMLSPSGRCHSFDTAADGYVRGEGIAVVVLRRADLAIRAGNPLRALIAGSACNQDGRSFGLTAPNGSAQRDVIHAALKAAGVAPADVQYVEAHGTGTALGDPMEWESLATVLGTGRKSTSPCVVGSIKANIGHLEAAAGLAGLIKTVLCLQHDRIVPLAGFAQANPRLAETTALALERPADGQPLTVAAVTSMGFGGTNVHVVLKRAPQPLAPSAEQLDAWPLPLAAESAGALAALAAQLAPHLDDHASLPRYSRLAGNGRSRLAHRAVLIASEAGQARQSLDALATGQNSASNRASLLTGIARSSETPRIALVFAGQGAQRQAMGTALYRNSSAFRHAFDAAASAFQANSCDVAGWLLGDAALDNHSLSRTCHAQPALFAFGYAAACALKAWGVVAHGLIGHSLGEYVAACVAGSLSLAEACALVAARAELMKRCPGGAMAAIAGDPASIERWLANVGSAVEVAAYNASGVITVSGRAEALATALTSASEAGLAAMPLAVETAFHSVLMEPVLDEFRGLCQRVDWQTPTRRLYSNLTGGALERPDADYWVRHLRQPVRFADCIDAALADGIDLFVEIAAQPTLASLIRRQARGIRVITLGAGTPGSDEWSDALRLLGQLYCAGAPVDWSALVGRETDATAALPPYPFDLTPHWLPQPESSTMTADHHAAIAPPAANALSWLHDNLADLLRTTPAALDPARSFLELGADSLVMTELLSRLQQVFGIEIELASLFEGLESPAKLAARMGSAPGSIEAARLPAALPAAGAAVAVTTAAVATPQIAEDLRRQLATLLRTPAALLATDRSLLELGADSLVLTELLRLSDERYGAAPGMAELFGDLNTLDALAGWLARHGNQPIALALGTAPAFPCIKAPVAQAQSVAQPERIGIPLASQVDRLNAALPSASSGASDGLQYLLAKQLDTLRDVMSLQIASLAGTALPAQPAVQAAASPLPLPAAAPLATTRLAPPAPAGKQAGSLSPVQQAHIDQLARDYVARTGGSRRYAETHRQVFADYRSSLGFRAATKELIYPLVVESAQGSHLTDIDGHDYIDLTMAFGSSLFGHNPPLVIDALRDQLTRGIQVGPKSPLSGHAAALVAELTGCERVAFANSGTEAVMTALRLARAVTGRNRVVRFTGAYHGHSDGTLVKAGPDGNGAPGAPGVPAGVARETTVLEWGSEQALAQVRQMAGEVAAIVVEPVQSRRPGFRPQAFLQQLREIADTAGCALLFDEIITGFRLAAGGAQAWYGVRADLATYGKVAGGGMPIGIIAGRARFMDAIDGGAWRYGDDSAPRQPHTFFAGTFSAHPLTMAATTATLERIKADGENLYARLEATTGDMAGRLNAWFAEHDFPIRVDHAGSLFRFVFFNNFSVEFQPIEANLFFYHMTLRGVYIWEGHTCFLSTAHSAADVECIVRTAIEAACALAAGGFFPDARPPASALAAIAPATLPAAVANNAIAAAILALNEAALAAFAGALVRLGWSGRSAPGGNSLLAALGVTKQHASLLGRMLEQLSLSGALTEQDGHLQAVTPLDALAAGLDARLAALPAAAGKEIAALMTRCAGELPAVLTGKRDAVEILFQSEAFAWLTRLYTSAPGADVAIDRLIDTISAHGTADTPLRIIEVGAGTGAIARRLLQQIGGRPLEYWFTDISPAFLARAERELADPRLRYFRFDAEHSPLSQNIPTHHFDLVVASNVVHATRHLGQTLANLNQLLLDDGAILLHECTEAHAWLDLIFGITDGWWQREDHDLRPNHPLLTTAAWQATLNAAGFQGAEPLVVSGGQAVFHAQPARLLRLPMSAAQRQILVHLETSDDIAPAYNEAMLCGIRGQLNKDALTSAWAHVLSRHPTLRAHVAVDCSSFEVAPERPGALETVDFSALGEQSGQRALDWISVRQRSAFDPLQGPLLDAWLLKLADDEHWLFVIAHHLIVDGLSYGRLLDEVWASYAARLAGSAPALRPVLPAATACARLDAIDEVAATWWRRRLAELPPAAELPIDKKRPVVQRFEAERTSLSLPADQLAAVRSLGAKAGATPFMTLNAVWRVLLSRLCGTRRLGIGVPVSVHPESARESYVGFAVNILPLCTPIFPGQNFLELLREVRGEITAALEHKGLPFAEMVKMAGGERDPARPALVQVLFNCEAHDQWQAANVDVRTLVPPATHTKYELTLDVLIGKDGLELVLTYAGALFKGATARKLLARYAALLERLCSTPEAPLANVDILLEAEQQQLGLNPPVPMLESCLHELFEAQAEHTPDAVAIRRDTEQLTFRELDSRANRLAHVLLAHGIHREDRVAVCLPRSLDLPVSLLAVQKAGAAYVPIDPTYPEEHQRTILEHSGARLLLVAEAGAAACFPQQAVLALADAEGDLAAASPQPPKVRVSPQQLAYVIFTSGSTGVPKGVAIEHRTVCSFLAWAAAEFPHDERAGVLASTSVCFDLSVFELFLPLTHGGRVILVDNVLALAQSESGADITLVNTVPSAMAELARAQALPPNVRVINLAGEALPEPLVAKIRETWPRLAVCNLYGPTEDTTYSTWLRMSPGEKVDVTIGRPLPGTRLYLLDDELLPVPPGSQGEIWLAGNGLARGYLERPGMTAERFLPDPHAPAPGARMYQTGDLGRLRKDGTVEYMGRRDDQVKIRGHRIELGAIDSVLRKTESVTGGAVVAHGEPLKLAAFYIANRAASDNERLEADIRLQLASRLPRYMMPASFERLSEMPLTPNGKIDRKVLREMAGCCKSATPAGQREPRSEIEAELRQRYAEVLGRAPESIGIDDDFFSLGGHSLLATRLLFDLNSAWQVELRLADLMRGPSVAELAERLVSTLAAEVSDLASLVDEISQDTPPARPLSAD